MNECPDCKGTNISYRCELCGCQWAGTSKMTEEIVWYEYPEMKPFSYFDKYILSGACYLAMVDYGNGIKDTDKSFYKDGEWSDSFGERIDVIAWAHMPIGYKEE